MVKVLSSQSAIDIAIQTSGDATAALALAIANGISLTDELTAGQELATVGVVSADVANYYNNKKLTPATAATENLNDADGIFNEVFNSVFS